MAEKIIQRLSDLPDFRAEKALVLDTETSGVSVHHGDRACGIVIGALHGEAEFYLPIRHVNEGAFRNLPSENVFSWLGDLLKDPAKTWIGHNWRFDLAVLRAEGLEMAAPLVDTMVLAHIVKGDRLNYSLDILTQIYCDGFEHHQYAKLKEYLNATQRAPSTEEGKIARNYSLVPIEILGPYACEDVRATRLLVKALCAQKILAGPRAPNFGNPSWSVGELVKNDMQLVKVLFNLEWRGVKIDIDKCQRLKAQAADEAEVMQDKLYRLAGSSFSVESWKELWTAFEKAGGQIKFWGALAHERGKQKLQQFTENRERSTGRPCWNAVAILKYLEHFKKIGNQKAFEFVRLYHEIERRKHLSSLYLDALLRGADANNRLHGQFHQHRVVTGRLSSSNPNLQNISKVGGTADQKAMERFLGEKNEAALNRQIRSLFIAEPGNVFVSGDWSNVEYRVATYFARDEFMMRKFQENKDADYHQITADLLGVDRDVAKTLNFMTLYFGGAKALAATFTGMGRPCSEMEAKDMLNRLFAARQPLKQLMNDSLYEARQNGFIQNPFGRICFVQSGFEYVGLNYRVQGACGDLMRTALVRLDRLIQQNNWPVKMILTVHDEICFEMPKDVVLDLTPKLAAEMCVAPWFRGVPITCGMEVGSSWGELKEWSEVHATKVA